LILRQQRTVFKTIWVYNAETNLTSTVPVFIDVKVFKSSPRMMLFKRVQQRNLSKVHGMQNLP